MVIVSAVGIATMGKEDRPEDHVKGPCQSGEIQAAMEIAVLNCKQQGEEDPAVVKARIMAARDRVKRDIWR
jgi:hypothetical protein